MSSTVSMEATAKNPLLHTEKLVAEIHCNLEHYLKTSRVLVAVTLHQHEHSCYVTAHEYA